MKRIVIFALGLVGALGLSGDRMAWTQPPVVQPAVTSSAATAIDSVTITDRVQSSTFQASQTAVPRRVTSHYPVVSGIADPILSARVQDAVDYWHASWSYPAPQWPMEITYQVNYNQKGMLALTYTVVTYADQTQQFSSHRVVHLNRGDLVRLDDLFKAEALAPLSNKVDRVYQAEQTAKNPKFAGRRIRIRDLEGFAISSEGVTFQLYDGISGSILLPFAALRPYVKPNGVLGFVVRAGG